MKPDPNRSLAAQIKALKPELRKKVLDELTYEQLQELNWDWTYHARPEQLSPEGRWKTWLILAGRGWGKTRTAAEFIRSRVCGKTPLIKSVYGHSRIALVGETAGDVRDVMVEGDSGLLVIHPKDFRPTYEPSKRRVTWPNGAVASLFNGTEPDQLRGPQNSLAWCDEVAKFAYLSETWSNLQFGLRLPVPDGPRQVITTTPRPVPLLRDLSKRPTTVLTRGRTYDNRENLAESFFSEIITQYEGTRLGRQELDAEILDDTPGALWTRDMLESCRAPYGAPLPPMRRIVIGVDPSGREENDPDGARHDEQGILVCGLGEDGLAHVIADLSTSQGPSGWARIVAQAFDTYKADLVVAEVNFGGGLVSSNLRTVAPNLPVKTLHVSRGKSLRAEPISSLFEQRRVRLHGTFPQLEDQMCLMTNVKYTGEGSPDRADSLVFALSELMLGWRNEVADHAGTPIQVDNPSSNVISFPTGGGSSDVTVLF